MRKSKVLEQAQREVDQEYELAKTNIIAHRMLRMNVTQLMRIEQIEKENTDLVEELAYYMEEVERLRKQLLKVV